MAQSLEDLLAITSSEPYLSNGGIRIPEIVLKPWAEPGSTFIFEVLLEDFNENDRKNYWEVTSPDVTFSSNFPIFPPIRATLLVLDDHPILWTHGPELYFSITNTCNDISSLMGDLFAEHSKACGNWIDFGRCYHFLPIKLSTLEHPMMAIPEALAQSCFSVLNKYNVRYKIDSVTKPASKYKVLFFSYPGLWPDETNFGQPYIVAENFSARILPDYIPTNKER